MVQIAFANLNRAEVAPRLALRGGGRRRLDKLVAGRVKHLAGKPFLVSVHRAGSIFAPTEETVRIAAVPAEAEPHEIPLYGERLWSRTYVARGDTVLITILPQGGSGGTGAAKIGLTVAALALMVIAPYLAGAIAPGLATATGLSIGAAKAIITAGIMIGGGAILSAFARQGNQNNKLYGISGGGNLARPNERIPVGFGTFWNTPDLSQPDYFSYDGDDMTLFKRMTIGCGKYEIAEIRVGQTTLWTAAGPTGTPNGGIRTDVTTPFAGTQLEIIYGQASALVPGDVLTSGNVSGLTLPLTNDPNPIAGPYRVTAPGVEVSRLQVDYSYPNGYFKSNTGTSLPIDVWFEYAECDDSGAVIGSWANFYREANGSLKIMGPKRFTRYKDVPLGQYVVRARNNVFRFDPDAEANFQRDISWDALRGHTPDTRIRTGITEVCLKVRSGKSLTSTSFADVQVKARRRGPVWNGAAFVEGYLAKSVDIYADMLTDTFYGGGIDPDLVAFDKVLAYQLGLTEFDTFDGMIRGPDTLWGACRTVLANVRAEPVRIGAGYSFVRDEPKAIRRHTFSRRQILRGSTSIDYDVEADDGSAHVQIAYHEGTDPKRPNYAEQYYGTPSAFGPRRIEWPGLSSYGHAVHIARWLAASGFYRRARISFDTELAGRLVFRGDPIAVDPWFLDGRSVSGVLSASGNTLTLDCDVAVVPGDYAMLRDRGGEEWGPVRVSQGAGDRIVALNNADVAAEVVSTGLALVDVLAPETANPTTIIIGQLAEHGEQWLVESMQPKEKGRATSVTAKLDSAAVYDAIGAVIPPDSPITWPLVTEESPGIRTFSVAIKQHTSSLELQFSILASAGASMFEVEVSQDAQDYTQFYIGVGASGTGPIRFSDTNLTARARVYGSTGIPGAWTTPTSLVVPKPMVLATDLEASIVKYTALDLAMQNLQRAFVGRLQDMQAQLDQIGGAVSSIESVTTLENYMRVERAKRIQANLGDTTARVTMSESVLVDMRGAFAGLGIDVDAISGTNSAGGYLRIVSTANPDGSLATAALGVSSTRNGVSNSAAIELAASGGASILTLRGDQIYAVSADGLSRIKMFDATGRLVTGSLADNAVTQVDTIDTSAAPVRIRQDRYAYDAGATWMDIASFTIANKSPGSTVLVNVTSKASPTPPPYDWFQYLATSDMSVYLMRLIRVGSALTPYAFQDSTNGLGQVNSSGGDTFYRRRATNAFSIAHPDISVSGSQTYKIQILYVHSLMNSEGIIQQNGAGTYYAVNVNSTIGPSLYFDFVCQGWWLERKK